jgi:predicted esterase
MRVKRDVNNRVIVTAHQKNSQLAAVIFFGFSKGNVQAMEISSALPQR